MEIYQIFVLQFFIFVPCTLAQTFSCKGDGGNRNVDWFIALKLPKLKTSKENNKREGIAYAYTDSTMNHFILSSRPVTDDKSAMGATVKSVVDAVKSPYYNTFARIFYNDQPPIYDTAKIKKKPSSSYGHSKGTIAFDKQGGFWMIHSVPRFPSDPRFNYKFPRNAKTYGQSFLCVSFPFASFNEIARHLLYVRPFIYDFNLPLKWNQIQVSNVVELLKNVNAQRVSIYPEQGIGLKNYLVQKLQSSGGQPFVSFAKNKIDWDITDFIIRDLKLGHAYAQTWRRGGSLGNTMAVTDVKVLNVLGEIYSTTKDHSKYLVQFKCSSQSSYYVCIGDLNRMISQKTRGGGYLCLNIKHVWVPFLSFTEGDKITQPSKRRQICKP